MRCDKHGRSPKDFAPETVANLKPVLVRFLILTIKCSLPIYLRLKRETPELKIFLMAGGCPFPLTRFGLSCAFNGFDLSAVRRRRLSDQLPS